MQYVVIGADMETGQEVCRMVRTPTPQAAEEWASEQRIMVQKVIRPGWGALTKDQRRPKASRQSAAILIPIGIFAGMVGALAFFGAGGAIGALFLALIGTISLAAGVIVDAIADLHTTILRQGR